MANEKGRIQLPVTSTEIAQLMLEDFELEARAIGVTAPPVQPGTDEYVLAHATSKLMMLGFASIRQSETDASVFDADADALENQRKQLGLPEIPALKATGRIVPTITGTVTFVDGLPLSKAGVRYQVNGTQFGLVDGDELNVIAVTGGKSGNLDSGETITFDTPPFGVTEEARVSQTVPLTGGKDSEDTEAKRQRILNQLQLTPAGDNPGHIRKIAFEAGVNIDGCYCYPALGGPSSSKTVITVPFDPDTNDWSRVIDSSALSLIRAKIQAELPLKTENVVTAAADETVNVALAATLPDSALAGGDGTGWIDADPWPTLTSLTYCTVTTVTSTTQITVNADDATSPIAGLTHIAWWSPGDMQFVIRLVTVVSGSTGAWVLTLDKPLVDSENTSVAVGDYISPAAVNMVAYGNTWRDIMGRLGPGEAGGATSLGARCYRIPDTTSGPQSDLTTKLLLQLQTQHPEIDSLSYAYRSATTPTVPSPVATEPNILVPNHFGIYEE